MENMETPADQLDIARQGYPITSWALLEYTALHRVAHKRLRGSAGENSEGNG